MEHKLFRTKFQLWDYLQHKSEGVDLNTTLRMPIFWIAMEDGEMHKNRSAKQFAECFNKLFDCNIDPKLSYRSRQSCVLFFGEVEKQEIILKPKELSETDVKALTGYYVANISPTIDLSVKIISYDVDWEWISSLKSNRDDKLRLDKYADEKFGISLNRGKKLDNMIEDFKSELAKKGA